MNAAEIQQLRDLLEVLKAGQVDIAIEWLEAATKLEARDYDVLEAVGEGNFGELYT